MRMFGGGGLYLYFVFPRIAEFRSFVGSKTSALWASEDTRAACECEAGFIRGGAAPSKAR